MSQLHFFDTIGLSDSQFLNQDKKAERQEWRVYDILKEYGTHLTPFEIHAIYCKRWPECPITSIRRCLTRGTDAGIFEKCYVSKKGKYNLPNWQWKTKEVKKEEIKFT